MAEYTIIINKKECIGCGMCENSSPDLFMLGDDGKAQAKKESISEKEYPPAKEVAENCPVSGITLKKK
ncbi:MAG: ferredoxin [Nanoarchaeota archaeon]